LSSFPESIEAVLLAGGKFEDLPGGEEVPVGKGLVKVGGVPMAARTLKALKESPVVSRVILVSPVEADALTDPCWNAVDVVVPAGVRLIDSFKVGMEAVQDTSSPAMVVAGDLPFLTAESVTDFVGRCRQRQEVSVWYGFLRKKNSEAGFPGVRHTYAKLAEGTFCGAGLFMSRPKSLSTLYQAMTDLTYARKNPAKLASLLGWGTVFSYLLGRLTISDAEAGMSRLLGGTPCAGIESPYPETAFNVDDPETLSEARRYLEEL
jgi:GTP:adenosylcobinamide-phosphate guanylyltransferase